MRFQHIRSPIGHEVSALILQRFADQRGNGSNAWKSLRASAAGVMMWLENGYVAICLLLPRLQEGVYGESPHVGPRNQQGRVPTLRRETRGAIGNTFLHRHFEEKLGCAVANLSGQAREVTSNPLALCPAPAIASDSLAARWKNLLSPQQVRLPLPALHPELLDCPHLFRFHLPQSALQTRTGGSA